MSEIVGLTGRDRKTVSTWIRQGERYPHARQDQEGRRSWYVPVSDLVAAGDLDSAQVVEVETALEGLRESRRVSDLRAQLADLQAALLVQTALAEERRHTIEILRAVLGSTAAPGGAR